MNPYNAIAEAIYKELKKKHKNLVYIQEDELNYANIGNSNYLFVFHIDVIRIYSKSRPFKHLGKLDYSNLNLINNIIEYINNESL